MDDIELFGLIVSRAVERGLRIGQLFENIRVIFRYVGQDLFYVPDDDLLMVATRLVNGDDIQVWQAEELRAQISRIDKEIEKMKAALDMQSIEQDSARELADFLNHQYGGDSSTGSPNQYRYTVT